MANDYSSDPVWRTLVCAAMGDGRLEEFAHEHQRVTRLDVLIYEAMRMDLATAVINGAIETDQTSRYPPRVKTQLYDLLAVSREVATACATEAAAIADMISQNQVRAVFTKGIVLADWLYRPAYVRRSADIDIMCHPEDSARLQDILVQSGYVPAVWYDRRRGQLVERTRRDLARYRVSPDHLPHFHKLTGTSIPPVFVVDVALSLTWHHAVSQVPAEALFVQRDRSAAGLPALTAPWHFTFLLLHFFREGWFYDPSGGLRLPQLADIALCWLTMSADERLQVVDHISEYNLSDPVMWSAIHVDSIFGTTIHNSLGLLPRTDDDLFAGTARRARDDYVSWEGGMLARLVAGATLTTRPTSPPSNRAI